MGTTSTTRTVLAAAAAGLVLCSTLGLAGCSSPVFAPFGGVTAAGEPQAPDAQPADTRTNGQAEAAPASGTGESGTGESGTPASGTGGSGTGASGAAASERKVARTAQLTLVIADPAESAKAVRAAAEGLGGYVAAENLVTEQKDGLYTQASTITVAVPSATLDEALDALAKLGDLRSRVVNAVDVTTRVVDTDARVKTLRESIDRVRALMDKAGSVAEIARVEDELTQRQSQLESLLAEQAALADAVAMTPVTITLRPAVSVTEPNPLWQGFMAGWQALLTSLRVLITVIAALLPFAALAALVWLPARAWRRRTSAGRSTPGAAVTSVGTTIPDAVPVSTEFPDAAPSASESMNREFPDAAASDQADDQPDA